MSAGFFKIDPLKLIAPGEDLGAGAQVVGVPFGAEASPSGLIWDVRIGKYTVRFLCAIVDGTPRFASLWKPERPKRLKPALVKKFRRERLAFAKDVAETFGVGVYVVDRMGDAPRVTDLIHEDGATEVVDLPVPGREAVH
jgi:hypothetical protein